MLNRRLSQLAIIIVALSICGCQDDKPVPMALTERGIVRDVGKETYVPAFTHPDPMRYTPTPGIDNSGKEIVKHDPLLTDTPQPFDVTTPDDTTTDTKAEAPVDLADPLTSSNRPNNWYWLKGTIRKGQVEVMVNGRDLGRFSVRMDREITDNLHKGYNTIEFTPLPDLSSEPVDAKLKIVFSQQEPGAAPVLTYDTTREQLIRGIRRPTHAPKLGGDGFDADPAESSALNAPTDTIPRTTKLTLLAH